jgi:hypothetical protein
VVVTSESNRFSSPMENILHWERGRSWVPGDIPNTSGVKRKHEQKNFLF